MKNIKLFSPFRHQNPKNVLIFIPCPFYPKGLEYLTISAYQNKIHPKVKKLLSLLLQRMLVDLNMIVFQQLLPASTLQSLLSFLEGVSNKYFVDGARGPAASVNLKPSLNMSANFSIKRLHRLLIFSRSFAKRWASDESAYRSRKILIQSELSISSAIILISSISFWRMAQSPFLRLETPASIPFTFSTSLPASSSA